MAISDYANYNNLHLNDKKIKTVSQFIRPIFTFKTIYVHKIYIKTKSNENEQAKVRL